VSGKCLLIGQPEQFTTKAGNTKITRSIIMEVFSGNYPNEVEFIFGQANMGSFDKIKEGEWITITFALKGSKSIKDGKAKWWNKLEGLSIIK
jgi:uncharacterized protein YbbC (DUF1343 family)